MANLYVASTGSNTAPYDTWAKAATAPLTATAAAAAGDTIYQHAETFDHGRRRICPGCWRALDMHER